MIINREGKGIMGRRVQYARNYLELWDLFECNQIDVWETMSGIDDQLDAAGIETPGWDSGVTVRKIIQALRGADMDSKPRLAGVVELERELRYHLDQPTDDLPGREPEDRLATTPFLKLGEDAGALIARMTSGN